MLGVQAKLIQDELSFQLMTERINLVAGHNATVLLGWSGILSYSCQLRVV